MNKAPSIKVKKSTMPDNIQQLEKYTEAGQVVRHYSSTVVSIREFTIIQGLIIIGAVAYLTEDTQYWYALATAVFGLFFTYILFTFHARYLDYFYAALDYIIKLENGDGPWTSYNIVREKLRKRFFYKIGHLYGSITVILLTLFSLIIYNTLRIIFK